MSFYTIAKTAFLCIIILSFLSIQALAGVKAWYTTSTLKVMRDAKPQHTSKYKLYAAKNEVEACQLVLLSNKPVRGIKIQVSDLKHNHGKGTLKAKLFRMEYVPLTDKNIPYPDPLPPLTGSIDLQPNQAQPIWISIRVPKDAVRGLYKGEAIIEANGVKTSYPLSVSVWNFALPDTPSSATAFGIIPSFIARTHGIADNSAELAGLTSRYYEMLLDHKVSPYNIPVDLMSKEAEKYLNDPRMSSYSIPYSDSDEELVKTADRLRAGGWLSKGYYYPIDEPVTPEAYEKFKAIISRLKRLVPDYKMVTPFFRHPAIEGQDAFTQMTGSVNIWCPTSNIFDTEPRMEPYMAERREAGDTTWWYVCWLPHEPYNNFLVDMSAMSHRVLLWQQRRLGMQGLLYWSTTYWNANTGCVDPWTNMMTVADLSPTVFGDGSLLYPGKKVGIDGPVSSCRLEMIREGLEDFDYFTIADKVLGPEVTQSYVTQIAHTLTNFERDPKKLEKVRKELGTAIERAIKQ